MIPLLKKLLSRPARPEPAAVRALAPPRPETDLYVVGDVHGRRDLLVNLTERLMVEVQASNREWRLIFVGDYIDRGEESAGVLPFLQALDRAEAGRVVCLLGNHEQMMLDFLDDPVAHGAKWLRYGGLQTLASFGLRGTITAEAGADTLRAVAQDFRRLLPAGLLDWVRARPLSFSSGNVCVVHAGADPALTMGAQTAEALLWGHPQFRSVAREDGTWIVHGHSIVEAPSVAGGRIAIDTGAVFTSRLTAAAIYTDGVIDFAS
jgi:serine/threonine protein phosphatase 1